MSHPLNWPFKHFFYPIGNTSATCLTQDLPVEQAADVLLLGCGDIRNILYTVYADLHPHVGNTRELDFTCCDIEPAILARNILLYTLACSGASPDDVWNIFYHFYLDDQSYELLEAQCRLLATASESMRTWQCSEFGAYLKMCNNHTLAEMHRHWQLYAAFSSKPRSLLDQMQAEQKDLSKKISNDYNSLGSISRSAGMLWLEAMRPMNDLYQRYWKTGTTFSSARDSAGARKLNPSFIYTLHGEKFVPHYGTFPPQAFHLTPAFVHILRDERRDHRNFTPMDVVKEQFSSWCGAFKEAVGSSRSHLVIRFCVGDVLRFCKALHNMSQDIPTRLFTSPFSGQGLELDGESPPYTFDLIDTSNLMDHIGLLNLLVSTKPLLKPLPTSVLYTETLLAEGEDTTVALLGRMCGGVSTMSLLVGLTPRSYLSGFNTHSNVHELLYNSDSSSKQFHERVAWCAPTSGDPQACREQPIVFDSAELGAILFSVYDQICGDEKTFEAFRDPRLRKLLEQQDHDRASFAQLVRLAMSRVDPGVGGWETTLDVLFKLVEEDRTRIVGLNYYQEFCLQLHLHGVTTTKSLSPMWRSTSSWPNGNFEVFRGWAHVPPVVCVLFTIPRDRLKVFSGTERLGSMVLLCHLLSSLGYDNAFSCNLQAIPGRLERDPADPTSTIIVRDARGVDGATSFVVSFLAPSWLLTIPQTKVIFAIKSTPRVAVQFMRKLGLMLEIFSAQLTDKKHVCIVKERPGVFADPRASEVLPEATRARVPSVNKVSAQMDDTSGPRGIATLTLKLDLATMGFTSPLAPSLPITAEQAGACTMAVTIGEQRRHVQFPFPIEGSQHKLRVARKSLYIEVIVPPFTQPKGASRTLNGNIFPIMKTVGLTPWNVHHVNLDIAPILDTKKRNELDWITAHTVCQFSERETALLRKMPGSPTTSAPQPDLLMDLKCTIRELINNFFGLTKNGTRARIFLFFERGTRTPFMLVFVHHVRLDLPSFTLLADAAVIPLDSSGIFDGILGPLLKPLAIPAVPLSQLEVIAWKQLLPAVVERCRSWPHGPNCEYASGRIPVSVELDANPLCGCGRGIGLPDAMPDVPTGLWQAARPFATRAAISPLFAVSYLESVVAAEIASGARDAGVYARTQGVNLSQGTVNTDGAGPSVGADERCLACGGPGKPKLFMCGKCKQAKYCSPACNKADWKTHKLTCRPA
ncbi:uncharacterized protein C8Q71DRAFT_881712 [Rhodofomes roseus]|uniref:MYND-type domain-containing protein n=1 Tax=Rhodofomes roseus TaxID=34475 RepID=A0ABQ8K409_9APHY|nr:uncharacterized protein C8Q71DRAFT_881712 [Rhodofomes roseus]KAH9831606.1 hypothetical protein C8Q71DRAFT_881712 [Rhodofomes roseus]